MTRLLVFTPTYDDALRPETAASIAVLRFDGELLWECSKHNPYPGADIRNVLAQYQRARELVLAGDYDGLLTVEHDMQLPPDAAQKLWDTPAGVVYGTYMLRHGSCVLNAYQYCGDKNLGMSLSLYPKELMHYRKLGVGRVSGVGWGCTLIRREVLQQVPVDNAGDGDTAAGDIPFARKCLKRGITMLARFDVECGHYHEGQWLRPYTRGSDALTRAVALKDVVINQDGQTRRLIRDIRYTLPIDLAHDLMRAGYVQIVLNDTFTPPMVHPAAQKASNNGLS